MGKYVKQSTYTANLIARRFGIRPESKLRDALGAKGGALAYQVARTADTSAVRLLLGISRRRVQEEVG